MDTLIPTGDGQTFMTHIFFLVCTPLIICLTVFPTFYLWVCVCFIQKVKKLKLIVLELKEKVKNVNRLCQALPFLSNNSRVFQSEIKTLHEFEEILCWIRTKIVINFHTRMHFWKTTMSFLLWEGMEIGVIFMIFHEEYISQQKYSLCFQNCIHNGFSGTNNSIYILFFPHYTYLH